MTVSDIKSKVTEIIDSKSKAELLIDLLTILEEESVSSKVKGIHALNKAWTHVIRRDDLKIDKNDETDKYKTWIREVFQQSWDKLTELISDDDNRVSNLAISTTVGFIVTLHETNNEDNRNFWDGEEVKLFRSIVQILLSNTNDQSSQIERFQEYMEYHDVKQHVIQGMAKIVHSCGKKNLNSCQFRSNAMKLLEILDFKDPKDTKEEISTLLCKNATYNYEHENVKKSFSSLWEDFIKLNSKDVDLYKRMLIILHDKVMPQLIRPLMLTDFLIESYNVGGSISLLALNGVFHLMDKYNLEYPDFYQKLYALMTPDVLHVKYRARFFHLTDKFLMSTHLPEYLVAAFVKRISRISLTAPANALLMVLPFIGNLILRHRGLIRMIDGSNINVEKDPFDEDEPDPAKCNAIESDLHEIRTLQSSALPQVSQMAKFINKQLPQIEWDLTQYLEITMEDMMSTEYKKKVFVNVPLTFERPNGLKFQKQDIVAEHFEFL